MSIYRSLLNHHVQASHLGVRQPSNYINLRVLCPKQRHAHCTLKAFYLCPLVLLELFAFSCSSPGKFSNCCFSEPSPVQSSSFSFPARGPQLSLNLNHQFTPPVDQWFQQRMGQSPWEPATSRSLSWIVPEWALSFCSMQWEIGHMVLISDSDALGGWANSTSFGTCWGAKRRRKL